MNRRTLAILEKCGLNPLHLASNYQGESHPAERKAQVVNLATTILEKPTLDLSTLPANDRKCAEAMIEAGLLDQKNHLSLKIKNRTWRTNKRRNKELMAIVKNDGIKQEVINTVVAKTAKATSNLVDEFAPQLKKHFAYSQEEKCLKLKNIPTLQEAGEALKGSIELMHGSTLAQSESKWIMGNVIDEIVNTYGDKLKMKDIANAMGIKTNTMSICLGVYRTFKSTRVHGLSFSHHREVQYCHAVSPALKMDMLFTARKYGMSVMELRRLCAYMRTKLEMTMIMPKKVLKKDLNEVLFKNMSDHVTVYVLMNIETGYSRYLRGKLTDTMLSKFNWIMQIKPVIEVIKGRVERERPPRRSPSKRKVKGPREPSTELAILSPCETFAKMTPNPFYKEEMEIYEKSK